MIQKYKEWIQVHHKGIKRGICGILVLGMVFLGFCVALRYKAADIFNHVAAERDVFHGTVTVEQLSASPWGTVSFKNLVWLDEDGTLLAKIPEGSFHVKIWDVVSRHIGTQTVTDVSIDNAYIHLFFDDHMELRHMKGLSDADEVKREKNGMTLTGLHSSRPFDCQIHVSNSTIEADSPQRHFTIDNVILRLDLHTRGITKMELSAGPFSGVMEADRMQLGGTLDFTKDLPQYDMYLKIKDCKPQSFDVGFDVDDTASAYAKITGDLPHPVIDGTVSMDQMNITALRFTDVKGLFHYEDGHVTATQVSASAFGGAVKAVGSFDLNEKSYYADIFGENLRGSKAAHDNLLRCKVRLDLHMSENKTAQTKDIHGSFSSSPGQYHFVPFNQISGQFRKIGNTLLFEHVVISMAMGDVTTDAFRIVDGKVQLGPIYLDSAGNRSKLR